jgi:hypothetical protein
MKAVMHPSERKTNKKHCKKEETRGKKLLPVMLILICHLYPGRVGKKNGRRQ